MASKQAEYRQILELSLQGDFEAAERRNAEVGDIPFSDSAVLVGAVFFMAVQQRFESDSSLAAVQAFVKQTLAEYAEADPPLKPLVTEGLVRAVLGEEELMQGIDASEAVSVQMALIYKIVGDLELSKAQIAKLLDDGEELVKAWSA